MENESRRNVLKLLSIAGAGVAVNTEALGQKVTEDKDYPAPQIASRNASIHEQVMRSLENVLREAKKGHVQFIGVTVNSSLSNEAHFLSHDVTFRMEIVKDPQVG